MTFWETLRLKARRALSQLFEGVGILFIGVGGVWCFFLITESLVEFLKAPIGMKEVDGSGWIPLVLLVTGNIFYNIAKEMD